MLWIRAARVWLASVVVCGGVLAAWVATAQLLTGRMSHAVHNMVDVSFAFGAVFALTAAVVHVPVFIALSGLLVHPLRRAVAVLVGVGLAPAAYLAVAWRFRDAEDPHTVAPWAWYWAGHIPDLVIGSLPFAAAGAVFGLLWSGAAHGRVSSRVERAV
jgi:hypothetical protein